MTIGVAVVGGRVHTGLVDLTSDLAALDGAGQWVAVLGFEGDVVCARFDRVDTAASSPWAARPWRGPARGSWASTLDDAGHAAAVNRVRDAIGRGDVYQVNVCRVLSAESPVPDPCGLAAALARAHPSPFAAVVDIPEAGVHVVSASPELFLRRSGSEVESAPIKGTASAADGFLAKDRAENLMIVDLVRNDLGRVCEYGSIHVPDLFRVDAHPGLHHLVSTVRGRLRPDCGWADLFAATFPPGSVVGAPKEAALGMIRQLEPVPRGPYCGALGYVDADRGVGCFSVSIRTFWWSDGCLRFGTGGAVTWDSTAGGEWEETELKAKRLLAVASS